MDQAFIDILKKIVAEQGETALTNAKKCKALLADYTKNEYKKESRLLLQVIEAEVAKTISTAGDLVACKKAMIRDLEEEQGLNAAFATNIVNILALVLRGDTTVIEVEKPTVVTSAPASSPAPVTPPSQKEKPLPAAKPTAKKTIGDIKVELKSVGKVYKTGVRAVEDISFNVRDGEFVLLRGYAASGKSAILKMIAGHEEITSGDVIIDGERMNNVPTVYRNIAIIPQDYAVDPDKNSKLKVMLNAKARLALGKLSFQMTVYENIAFDLQAKKVPKGEIEKRIKEVARILDFEKFLDRKIIHLSGGQMFRVSLARCVVLNPKVYLFDDPLTGIDAKNHASEIRAQLRDDLSNLMRSLKATVIYATGDQDEGFVSMADRVIEIKEGRII